MTRSTTRRPFSQLDSESDTNPSPTGVFANARSSYCSPDFHNASRALKRRKTSGLNARFDRMLEDMTLCQQKPFRRRARSSGSSSLGSYDIPTTPVDAYNKLSGSGSSQQYSDMKRKHLCPSSDLVVSNTAGLSLRGYARDVPLIMQTGGSQAETLPAWLSSTILSLDGHHPLRLLLPPSPPRFEEATTCMLDAGKGEGLVSRDPTTLLPEETSIFAFCPDQQFSDTMANISSDHEVDIQGQTSLRPSLIPRQLSPVDEIRFSHRVPTDVPLAYDMDFMSLPLDALQLPFSTPGPSQSYHLSKPHVMYPAITSPSHSSSLSLPVDRPFCPLYQLDNVIPDDLDALEISTPLLTNNRDPAQGNADLDLITRQFSASNPVPFSTPGPAHTLTYPDSPGDDLLNEFGPPCTSELDDDTLDFRWEPFDRKG